jgi:hypothetical protein
MFPMAEGRGHQKWVAPSATPPDGSCPEAQETLELCVILKSTQRRDVVEERDEGHRTQFVSKSK